MFASQAPTLDRPSKASGSSHSVNPVARWIAAFGAALFLFLMVEPSYACANRSDSAQHASRRAVTYVAKHIAASSQVVDITLKRSDCCGGQSHRCPGSHAGSCCPACTVGMFVTGSTLSQAFGVQPHFFFPNINFSSAPPDKQFRPPRTAL